jgi:hypothetical protein
MRAALVCLALSSLGCSSTDPDLAKDCAHRRPAVARVGTGQYQFIPLGMQGPLIQSDLQLGDYLWIAIGCRGLGPDVTLDFGIETAGGTSISVTTDQRVLLSYDSSLDLDEQFGLPAYFQLPAGSIVPQGRRGSEEFRNAAQLVGQAVTLWAYVKDGAGCYAEPIKAQTQTTIGGFDTTTCVGCLAQACAPQLATCDDDCFAVQACLDAYCVNLSTIASPDEVACQAWCQSQHPAGRGTHVALVGCVQSSMCQPPCYGYSIDYRHCTTLEDDPVAGPCAGVASCTGDCVAYKNCIGGCTTWASCQQCAQQHPAGEAQLEMHQLCLEKACLLQGWLPHM